MTSLRTRAITAGVIWAIVTIVLALAGLGSFMNTQATERFTEALETRHTQAIVAVSNYGESPEFISRGMSDPAFDRPFSGLYWQMEHEDGDFYVSPSLVDTILPRPQEGDRANIVRRYDGPGDDPVLAMAQWVTMANGDRWHVQVASSLDTLSEDQAALRSNLLTAFAIVASVGILGASAQVTMMLRPINALREEVAARWDEEDGLTPEIYPVEVAPLVADINGLMDRNRDIIRRSRRQAADLAHAVKTPSAIVRNELEALSGKGLEVAEAINALDRLDGQLKRSFARMRADQGEDQVGTYTDLDVALGRMDRAFSALARNAGKSFTASFPQGLRVRMDQNDFEEIMGNILDNALKWADTQVDLTVEGLADRAVRLTITDDGPGIPEDQLDDVIKEGRRLDSSVPGTGLGLSIASDLIVAYGGAFTLGRSAELGGFSFQMTLPTSSAKITPQHAQTDPSAHG